MTAGAVVGVFAALAAVLALLLVALRVLRRFAPAAGAGRARLPLEVVQRVAVGPKQGVAVVRVGGRVLVVGTGEGGLHTLAELDGADREHVVSGGSAIPAVALSPGAAAGVAAAGASAAPRLPRAAEVFDALRGSLSAGARALVLAAALGAGAGTAGAQAPAAAATAAPAPTTAAPATAAPSPAALPAATQNALVQAAVRQAALRQVRQAAPARLGAGLPAATQAPAAQPAPAAGAPVPVAQRAPTTTPPAPTPAPGFAARAPSGTAPPPPSALPSVDTMVARLAPTMDVRVGGGAGQGLRLSGTVGVVVMLGLLTLLPTIVLMMTGFTRILVVLHFLKQALGTQTAPPNQLVAGLALLLTGFVMAPTAREINRDALQPWLGGRIEQVEMLERASGPLRTFMLRQTRERDIETFVELSRATGDTTVAPRTPEEVPLVVLTSAFVTSELRTAFQLGFALFLPFIIIDVVVSSVLMSMGMMMLPPAMIALPFKLLLFVLVDGWTLVVQSLVQSFR
jgi:flagellar biosynthetic protein FliP